MDGVQLQDVTLASTTTGPLLIPVNHYTTLAFRVILHFRKAVSSRIMIMEERGAVLSENFCLSESPPLSIEPLLD